MLTQILTSLPSHHETPILKQELVRRVCAQTAASETDVQPAVDVALQFLELFSVLSNSKGYLRLSGQKQTYFRNALAWYVETNHPIVTNWDRSGAARDHVSLSNLLEQAPFLLKALEERRLSLANRKQLALSASREQPCSVVIFKIISDSKVYLLHQWDVEAERFQLIGGKQRDGESPEETAVREIAEELPGAQLVFGRNLFLSRSSAGPVEELRISPTYGALTHYTIHIFNASVTSRGFATAEPDLWISVEELISGSTYSNAPIAGLGGLIAREHRSHLDSLAPLNIETQSRMSKPLAISLHPSHESKPEIPQHLSLDWIIQLARKLTLHDSLLVLGLLASAIGISFTAGKLYEEHFGKHNRTTKTQAQATEVQ